jgi:ferric-dicitrate binding protein FerR (iron transport regulator)
MRELDLEKLLLLKQSGELTPAQAQELENILSKSDEARRAKDEIEQVIHLARDPSVAPTPTSSMQRILERAHGQAPRKQVIHWPSHPLVALAATLVLVAGLWLAIDSRLFTGDPASSVSQAQDRTYAWDDGFDEDLDQLSELVAAVNEELLLDDLDRLADELLDQEG